MPARSCGKRATRRCLHRSRPLGRSKRSPAMRRWSNPSGLSSQELEIAREPEPLVEPPHSAAGVEVADVVDARAEAVATEREAVGPPAGKVMLLEDQHLVPGAREGDGRGEAAGARADDEGVPEHGRGACRGWAPLSMCTARGAGASRQPRTSARQRFVYPAGHATGPTHRAPRRTARRIVRPGDTSLHSWACNLLVLSGSCATPEVGPTAAAASAGGFGGVEMLYADARMSVSLSDRLVIAAALVAAICSAWSRAIRRSTPRSTDSLGIA